MSPEADRRAGKGPPAPGRPRIVLARWASELGEGRGSPGHIALGSRPNPRATLNDGSEGLAIDRLEPVGLPGVEAIVLSHRLARSPSLASEVALRCAQEGQSRDRPTRSGSWPRRNPTPRRPSHWHPQERRQWVVQPPRTAGSCTRTCLARTVRQQAGQLPHRSRIRPSQSPRVHSILSTNRIQASETAVARTDQAEPGARDCVHIHQRLTNGRQVAFCWWRSNPDESRLRAGSVAALLRVQGRLHATRDQAHVCVVLTGPISELLAARDDSIDAFDRSSAGLAPGPQSLRSRQRRPHGDRRRSRRWSWTPLWPRVPKLPRR